MMQSSTRFVVLSRRLTLGQRQVQLTSSSCSSSRRQRWEPVFTSTNNNCQQRFLSTPQSQSEPDWVRASIQKLLEQQSASTGGTNEKETSCIRDLDKSLQALQNQLLEAELCVQDCHDCGVDEAEREQEIVSAHLAVDEAVACLVDLLDESRAATHSAHHHQLPTEELVRRIKQLRAELSKLKAPPLIDAKE